MRGQSRKKCYLAWEKHEGSGQPICWKAKNAPHPGLSPVGRGAGRKKFLAPKGRDQVRGKTMPTSNDSQHRIPPRLMDFARGMRKDPSKAENLLWFALRNRQINGWKFRRQQVVGNYIADFLCHDCHLIIELDGDSHDGRETYDLERTKWFQSQGYCVIRFTNFDVLENMASVIEEIQRVGAKNSSPRRGEVR